MVLYLMLAALGGLWMPVQILPSPLQTVARTSALVPPRTA